MCNFQQSVFCKMNDLVKKKVAMNQSAEQIATDLVEDVTTIQKIIEELERSVLQETTK